MQTCPRTDDAIAHAFAQLSGAELASFQEHLALCPACRLKLAEVGETVDLLAFAAPPAAPSPDLKQKVVRRVAVEVHRSRPPWRRYIAPMAAAAAVIAIAFGGYSLKQEVQELRQQLSAYQRMAPVQKSVALVGTDSAPGASGRVVVSQEGDGTRIELQAGGLPQLEPGQAYQLWLIKDGKRTSGGVFVIDGTGKGGVVHWLPGRADFDTLGVTREPDAFGQQPRGTKVLASTT